VKRSGDESARGTGRTTGLILQALGRAALARGEDVEFVDHDPHTHQSAHRLTWAIKSMAALCGLFVVVRREGSRVFVRSAWRVS